MKNYTIHVCNAKYGHHGNGKEKEEEYEDPVTCWPCYCGWRGEDHAGCKCNDETLQEMQFKCDECSHPQQWVLSGMSE